MCSCNMNRIYKWVLLISTHSETPSECPVNFVAVVHRMSKSDRNIGVVLFDCLSFISSGNVSNMWQQCRVACKTSNFKVSFSPILLTQRESSCNTIAAEEGQKSRSGQTTGTAFQHVHRIFRHWFSIRGVWITHCVLKTLGWIYEVNAIQT